MLGFLLCLWEFCVGKGYVRRRYTVAANAFAGMESMGIPKIQATGSIKVVS